MELEELFGSLSSDWLPELPRYNICPTQNIVTVVSREGQRKLVAMRWGFLPHWYKRLNDGTPHFNARSETIAEKPAFRNACRARRCLIPATGFYEWTRTPEGKRLPWYICPAPSAVFAFAGIWQDWERGDQRISTCAIVTTAANQKMSRLHHRMPVVIQPNDHGLWLGEGGKGAAVLMKAADENDFDFYRVGTEVNSNQAEGPKLIEPLD